MQFAETIEQIFLKHFNGVRTSSLKSLYVAFLWLRDDRSVYIIGGKIASFWVRLSM